MPSKIVATLDPHKLGDGLALSQGNLVVTTTRVCDFERAVFGTVAIGAGQAAFECQFWSTSQPAAGLLNLLSVGVCTPDTSIAQFVGKGPKSFGYRPAEGQVWNNNADISTGVADPALQPIKERLCIGVLLDMTAAIVSIQVQGSLIFQADLAPGEFYVPAVSIGSDTPGGVSAYLNFGQSQFNFPIFSVLK